MADRHLRDVPLENPDMAKCEDWLQVRCIEGQFCDPGLNTCEQCDSICTAAGDFPERCSFYCPDYVAAPHGSVNVASPAPISVWSSSYEDLKEVPICSQWPFLALSNLLSVLVIILLLIICLQRKKALKRLLKGRGKSLAFWRRPLPSIGDPEAATSLVKPAMGQSAAKNGLPLGEVVKHVNQLCTLVEPVIRTGDQPNNPPKTLHRSESIDSAYGTVTNRNNAIEELRTQLHRASDALKRCMVAEGDQHGVQAVSSAAVTTPLLPRTAEPAATDAALRVVLPPKTSTPLQGYKQQSRPADSAKSAPQVAPDTPTAGCSKHGRAASGGPVSAHAHGDSGSSEGSLSLHSNDGSSGHGYSPQPRHQEASQLVSFEPENAGLEELSLRSNDAAHAPESADDSSLMSNGTPTFDAAIVRLRHNSKSVPGVRFRAATLYRDYVELFIAMEKSGVDIAEVTERAYRIAQLQPGQLTVTVGAPPAIQK